MKNLARILIGLTFVLIIGLGLFIILASSSKS